MNIIIKDIRAVKRVIIVLTIVLIISGLPMMNNDAYASSYKTVNDSDFSALTVGKLTKGQVETVLNILIDFSGENLITHKLNSKEINNLGYDSIINQAALNIKGSSYKNGSISYPLKKVNRCLSFYTDHRFEKNSYEYDEYDRLIWKTGEDTFYYYGAYGTITTICMIQSAKYNDEQMVLKFTQANDWTGLSGITYTAILKAQDNGRYKLDSIYVTGNYKKFKTINLSKVTQGALDKKQFKATIGAIVKKHGLRNLNKLVYPTIGKKKINKIGNDYYTIEKILGKALLYKKTGGWYSYNLKKTNKVLSFFSNKKIRKNKKWTGNNLKWKSTNTRIKYNKKTSNPYKLKIESAYKNDHYINIWVSYSQSKIEARFKVTLTKQKNGKFKLTKIKRLYGYKSDY